MYERTVLANGLRVVTSYMPHTRSVSINLFVGAGSRYESDEQAGVSHFLEHMLFKGSRKRPSARQISEEIEGIGGVSNAATDKELTVYYAKVGHQHFARTFDILADIVRNPIFDPAELEKERAVIIEELNAIEDDPADLVSVLYEETMWPHQPLGRETGGTRETVQRLSREEIIAYWRRQYVPENVVVAVAGNVTHDAVVRQTEALLGDWERAPFGGWVAAVDGQDGPRVGLRSKKTEQAHLALGVPGYSSTHPDRFALDLLNTILGEGMSSRLFLEVRERLGLAYDVSSYILRFFDTGAAVVSAAIEPQKVAPTVEAVRRELEKLKGEVPEPELAKAREFRKGRIQLGLEDTGAVARWLGAQELRLGTIMTVDEVLDQYDRVTPDDLRRVASQLFAAERLNLAVVGPYRSEARLADLLR